jgi:hypothetical protein
MTSKSGTLCSVFLAAVSGASVFPMPYPGDVQVHAHPIPGDASASDEQFMYEVPRIVGEAREVARQVIKENAEEFRLADEQDLFDF